MLKLSVIMLLLANMVFLAWRQHWLSPVGLQPETTIQSEVIAQQMATERILEMRAIDAKEQERLVRLYASGANPAQGQNVQVTSNGLQLDALTTSNAQTNDIRCWMAVNISAKDEVPLRTALQKQWPSENWQLVGTPQVQRWLIYVGAFDSNSSRNAAAKQLKDLKIAYDKPPSKDLEPGLVLGLFDTQQQAQNALAKMNTSGMGIPPKVLQENQKELVYSLRIQGVATQELQKQWEKLKRYANKQDLVACANA